MVRTPTEPKKWSKVVMAIMMMVLVMMLLMILMILSKENLKNAHPLNLSFNRGKIKNYNAHWLSYLSIVVLEL